MPKLPKDMVFKGISDAELKEQMLSVMMGNLQEFSIAVCGDIATAKTPAFHNDIYELLLNNDRIVVAAPRGFAKSSTIAKIYAEHCALFKKYKDIIIISASESLAVEHLRYIKQSAETNEVIHEFFGYLVSDKWTENHIVLQHHDGTKVNLRAKGAGGQIRGYRPDLVIIDDLETDESVASEEQRKKLKDWLFKACFNCLLPGGKMIVIGTILNQLSLLNDLLEMPNGWVKRKFKAYIDGVQEPGHELWPEERPHAWLQQRKAEIGSHRFSAEYMNDPVSDENAPIKDEQIKVWDELPKNMNCVIAVDPAYSEDEKADFKVAVLIGIDSLHNRYLLDYHRSHVSTGEFIDAILTMYTNNRGRVTAVGVPCSGTEKEFYRSVVNKAGERNIYPPFVELKNTFTTSSGGTVRAKTSRIIAALQPLFENGKYFIGPNHYEAREELLTIGNSRWDDLVDAMAYAESILTPGSFEDVPAADHSAESEMAGACEGYGIEY